MTRDWRATLLGAVMVTVAAAPAFAQTTPAGRWKTVDDHTGETKAIVVITQTANGELEGRIEKVFSPPAPSPSPRCEKCPGAMTDQPVVGMRFLWGFTADGKKFSGGRLLDPESGKIYKGWMAVTEGGKKLEVRGYVGFSMLGRSQVWLRE